MRSYTQSNAEDLGLKNICFRASAYLKSLWQYGLQPDPTISRHLLSS